LASDAPKILLKENEMKRIILISGMFTAIIVCAVYITLTVTKSDAQSIANRNNETPEKLCCANTKFVHSVVSDNSIYLLDSKWRNEHNETELLKSLLGKKVILAMIYTNCTYACPLILNDMKNIESNVKRNDVNYVLISIDPKHDTPAILKTFADRNNLNGNKWHLLTGTENGINELSAVLGFKYKKEPDGSYSHSNIISVLNEDGEIAYQHFGLNQDVKDVLNQIDKMDNK
jgi:protein SCO1